MIWAFRIVAIFAAVLVYRTVFRDLDGYWPIAGLVLCIVGYVALTTLVERRVFSARR